MIPTWFLTRRTTGEQFRSWPLWLLRDACGIGACAGNASGVAVPTAATSDTFLYHNPNHKTFKYTGGEQRFTVPAGVKAISVVALGAAGGSCHSHKHYGCGGRVHAYIPASRVSRFTSLLAAKATSETGGFNGGGNAGAPTTFISGSGSGGGGASDVRQGGDTLNDRILIAGGGGGWGGCSYCLGGPGHGGRGGGKTGGTGGTSYASGKGGDGGAGGTQNQGGSGGSGGSGPYTNLEVRAV